MNQRLEVRDQNKRYTLSLEQFVKTDDTWNNDTLAKFYHRGVTVRCLCTTSSVDMHVRRTSVHPARYCLISNPGQHHAPTCHFHRARADSPSLHSISPNPPSANIQLTQSSSVTQPSSALTGLNAEQKEAATHGDGPCLVVAAAGSGKTKTIIARMVHLLDSEIPSHRILACTFTRKAAEEMKERLIQAVGERAKGVVIGTIHSVAYRMLKERLGEEWRVLADPSWLIEQVLLPTSPFNTYSVGPIMRLQESIVGIQSAKVEGKTPEQIPDKLGQVYAAYEQTKAQRKILDFEDLLLYAVRLLKTDQTFQRKWSKRWKYVMVDEMQDTNMAQWSFLLELVKHTSNLFAVGDDWQSVYGFRGARPDLMMHFKSQFPESKEIKLTTNYRSHDLIIELADSVIQLNSGHQIEKIVVAARDMTDTAVTQAVTVATDMEEAEFVAKEILRIKNQNSDLKWKDTAVLYRTNVQSRLFEEVLAKANIPCHVVGDKHFYEFPQVKVLLDYLRVTQDTSDASVWGQLLNRPRRYISRDVIQEVTAGGWDALLQHERCQGFVQTVQGLQQHRSPSDALKWLTDVHPELIRQDQEEVIKWLDALLSSAKRFNDISTFLRYIDWIIKVSKEPNKDAVQLMTIHQSKGLEFETVFVTGVAEGLLPHKKSKTPEEIREETRLCYVAITRAKENLYLLAARQYGETRLSPSRFMTAIQGGE